MPRPSKFKDFSKIKNSLDFLPFEELGASCNKANFESEVTAFASTHRIASQTWVYPQLLAHVGKWTLSRNSNGLFSGKQLVVDNCKNNPFNQGVYWFLMSNKRALVKAYMFPDYNHLVPLILAAHKKMNGIKYSEWDPAELAFVVDARLCDAMLCKPPEYTKQELIEIRTKGLVTYTGANPGKVKSAISTASINSLPREMEDGRLGLGSLPDLVSVMLCQTWCAHVANRGQYTVCDPVNWDSLPKPLIDSDPVQRPEVAVVFKKPAPEPALAPDKLPWDD